MSAAAQLLRLPLLKLALAAGLLASAGCAWADMPVRNDAATTVSGVTSYRIRVERGVEADVKALVSPAGGMLGGDGRTVECPPDVCDKLTGWINVAGFTAGRLANGQYIAIKGEEPELPKCARPGWCSGTISPDSDSGTRWWLRMGADIKAVTEGLVPTWLSDDRVPRWAPSIPAYRLHSTTPAEARERVFFGIWKSAGKKRPEYLIAIFRDHKSDPIGRPFEDRNLCVVATARAPVVAVSGSGAYHQSFGFTLVLRPESADQFHVLGYASFSQNLKCIEPPW